MCVGIFLDRILRSKGPGHSPLSLGRCLQVGQAAEGHGVESLSRTRSQGFWNSSGEEPEVSWVCDTQMDPYSLADPGTGCCGSADGALVPMEPWCH